LFTNFPATPALAPFVTGEFYVDES